MNKNVIDSVGSFRSFLDHWGGWCSPMEKNTVLDKSYLEENTPDSHSQRFSTLLSEMQVLACEVEESDPFLFLLLNDLISKGANMNDLFLRACNASGIEEHLEDSLSTPSLCSLFKYFGEITHRVMYQTLCDARNYIKEQE